MTISIICSLYFFLVVYEVINSYAFTLNSAGRHFSKVYDNKLVAKALSGGNENDSSNNGENGQITKMFELIVASLENNREDDLVSSGLKITKKSARETLDNKINDPQMQNIILGPSNDLEDIEILTRLQAAFTEEEKNMDNRYGYDDIGDGKFIEIDDSVYQELRDEAYQTLDEIRKKGSAMGRLLDDQEEFGTYITPETPVSASNFTVPSSERQRPSFDSKQQSFDPLVWGPSRGLEILLSPIDTALFPEFKDNSPKNSPPDLSLFEESDVREEEDYCDDDDSSGNIENIFMNKNDDGTIEVGSVQKVGEGRSKHFELSLQRADKFSYNSALYMSSKDTDYDISLPSTALENDFLENSNSESEKMFAALLRQSMQQVSTVSENSSKSSDEPLDVSETRWRTVDAITSGQVDKLGKLILRFVRSSYLANGNKIYLFVDMDALLGKTMATLAKQLDVDVRERLSQRESLNQMQNIIGIGMSELTAGLAEVDEQSQILYNQLENIQIDLKNETENFQTTKQMELDMFMNSQRLFQNEVVKSQKQMRNSTDTLQNLLVKLENEADLLSAIALFPLKTIDKKIAFVFGLTLFFKVPFDGFRVLFNSVDSNDWFGVIVQGLVMFACFNHYGLVKAAFQKPIKS